ncbi:MAG: RHS repeat protein [Verrucomicrobiaceae bacterium]|nr:RHS repeat protein [Verrucomicrobiaceae bacterium]
MQTLLNFARIAVTVLITSGSVFAFFSDPNNPDKICGYVGDDGLFRLVGPPGTNRGKLVVQSATSDSPNVAVGDIQPGKPITGVGGVNVRIKAVGEGTANVTFSGTYNGIPVDYTVMVVVKPALTSTGANLWDLDAGDPISTATGEYHGSEGIDLFLGGPMPLYFSRYYASQLAADGRVIAHLGKGRSHNFASHMELVAYQRYHLVLPDGRVLTFQKTGAKWVLLRPLDVPYELIESAGGFLLGHPHTQQIWSYNDKGQLIGIADGRGNLHTLAYNVGGLLTSVTDNLGRTLTFSYTADDITTVADHAGRQVFFVYTGDVLTSATDALGHATVFTYDGSDRLISYTRPEGNTPFTQIFTGAQVTSQTERGTDTSTLAYNPGSSTFTDPLSHTLVDTYDSAGHLLTHTDQEGHEISVSYDSAGRRNLVTDRLGGTNSVLYHANSGLPTTVTNAEGRKTTYTYKARKASGLTFYDLVKMALPDGGSRSFVYDAKGNLVRFTDEARKAWTFTRNSNGQPLSITNPLGGVSVFTYDASGNLVSSADPDTPPTTFLYDNLSRLVTVTHPDASTLQIAYDSNDRITSITDERSNTYTCTYDNNDRLTAITDPAGKTSNVAYDTLDRVTQTTDRVGANRSVAFDSRRLPVSLTDPNNNVVTVQYDSRQRPVSMTDPGNEVWQNEFDAEGLLISTRNPVNAAPAAKTQIRRNRLGRPEEISDALGNSTRFTRDPMQRVIDTHDPLGRSLRFTYDKRGLLTSASEQGTGTAKYLYDNLGLISRITDPNNNSWSFTRTRAGRLATETDPLRHTWSYSYDSRGRHTRTTYPDGTTVDLSYDTAGNLTRRLHSDGPDINATYDALNRLTSINDVSFNYDDEGRITNAAQNGSDFTATYDPAGRLTSVGYLSGAVAVTYTYDTRDRLISVSDNLSGASVTFGYDKGGRMISLTRSNGTGDLYSYDSAHRLTHIESNPGPVELSYTLNAVGEVTRSEIDAPVVPSAPAVSETFTFGKASEVTSLGYSYDSRGRLTSSPTNSYTWDGAGRLLTAGTVTFTYNGLNDITTRTDGAGSTVFSHHYALGRAPIVHEDPPGASLGRFYVWTPSGHLLYSIDRDTNLPSFYHFDRIGSTIAVTDSSGAVTDAYAYGPYGEPQGRLGTSSQPFTYVGLFGVRQEGGLYQMRARYYDPTIARFLSRDAIPPNLADPKSLNPYQYAAANPLRFIDPAGSTPTLAGSGRIGLRYDMDTPPPSSSQIIQRLRFNFDAARETDSGVTLGGRIRMQFDSGAKPVRASRSGMQLLPISSFDSSLRADATIPSHPAIQKILPLFSYASTPTWPGLELPPLPLDACSTSRRPPTCSDQSWNVAVGYCPDASSLNLCQLPSGAGPSATCQEQSNLQCSETPSSCLPTAKGQGRSDDVTQLDLSKMPNTRDVIALRQILGVGTK